MLPLNEITVNWSAWPNRITAAKVGYWASAPTPWATVSIEQGGEVIDPVYPSQCPENGHVAVTNEIELDPETRSLYHPEEFNRCYRFATKANNSQWVQAVIEPAGTIFNPRSILVGIIASVLRGTGLILFYKVDAHGLSSLPGDTTYRFRPTFFAAGQWHEQDEWDASINLPPNHSIGALRTGVMQVDPVAVTAVRIQVSLYNGSQKMATYNSNQWDI